MTSYAVLRLSRYAREGGLEFWVTQAMTALVTYSSKVGVMSGSVVGCEGCMQ